MIQLRNFESLPLPPAVRDILLTKLPKSELDPWAIEAIVVEVAREHIVSCRKAATRLGYKGYESAKPFSSATD
ncbi:hypothetical protein OP10G_1388 [Fimbriimonas ginsengisoli Gsoil 348]|uniref:Uncharacterized protein n=1 Tax=Fimbriimonas ginsengisoli Gsoil 348 TaxID=661478 RepID=A0A068NMR7_FIMGI|nr:hypothetical protein OP10G_1388 [Fimbriimonas ginsengisoli Gsoil 348]